MKPWFVVAPIALGLCPALACNAEEEALLAALGGGCLLDSDCEDGLACVSRLCHQRCNTSKDCPLENDGDHQTCVIGDKPNRVCQLTVERLCDVHSDCPEALLCGADGECRTACAGDRDCVAGQVCVAATCAEPDDEPTLRAASKSAGVGTPCGYHSDCADELRCREGLCDAACLGSDRDCGRFETCTTAGTDPPEAGLCTPIGAVGARYCSPKDDYPAEKEIECMCVGGTVGTQICKADASGYEPCMDAAMMECSAP